MDDVENLQLTPGTPGPPPSVRLVRSSPSMPTGVAPEIAAIDAGGPAESFEPGAVRYIKLGENGKWASKALRQGIIPFGYRLVDHHSCLAGDWDEVRRHLIGMGRTPQGASQGVREIAEFYSLPADSG